MQLGYCSLDYPGGLCTFQCSRGPHIRSSCTRDGTWDPYPTCDGDVRELEDGCNPCPGPVGSSGSTQRNILWDLLIFKLSLLIRETRRSIIQQETKRRQQIRRKMSQESSRGLYRCLSVLQSQFVQLLPAILFRKMQINRNKTLLLFEILPESFNHLMEGNFSINKEILLTINLLVPDTLD